MDCERTECHADNCILFFGGDDNLSGKSAIDVENWIRNNNSIPEFEHVQKKKKENYGFVHFSTEDEKIRFFNQANGREYQIGGTEKLTIKFQPLKRKKTDHDNNVPCNNDYHYNLYDGGSEFILLINIPTISDKDEISIFIDDDVGKVVNLNGEYQTLPLTDGIRILKKSIPTGKFNIKITFPSRIDLLKKIRIEKVENSNLFQITFHKAESYKRRKLSVE